MNEIGDVYRLAYETLKDNCPIGETEFNEEIEYWRDSPNKFQKDSDYFDLMVEVTFYSGFRSKTVTQRMDEIKRTFGNYQIVKNYNFGDVERIINEGKVISNVSKICSTILNAREFDRIVNKCGSFKEYLQTFNFRRGVWNEETKCLYSDLCTRFHYLSDVTAYHFLMEIGGFCIKPDRQIVALLKSLGIINDGGYQFKSLACKFNYFLYLQ